MTVPDAFSAARRIALSFACFYIPYFWVVLLAHFRSEVLTAFPILPGITIVHFLDWWPDGALNWATGFELVLWGTIVTAVLLGSTSVFVVHWRSRYKYVLATAAIVSSVLSYPAYLLMMA